MAVAPDPNVKFEDALRRLERIVDDLDRGEPELSAALAKYEQGVRLLAQCHAMLDQAEQSVALLTGVDASGDPVTAPFDSAAGAEREPTPDAPRTTSPRKRAKPTAADDDDRLIPF